MDEPAEAFAGSILRIFICYRRGDTGGHAGRLYDTLTKKLGKERVFMDVAGIEPGADFVERIDESVTAAQAMLVVIGRNWLEGGPAKRKRRLDDPNDYVRLEILAALRKNIRLIPILVQGAGMPSAVSLPGEIRSLARKQAFELRDDRWTSDTDVLIASLERIRPPTGPSQLQPAPPVSGSKGAVQAEDGSGTATSAPPFKEIDSGSAPSSDREKGGKMPGLLRGIGFSALALLVAAAILTAYLHLNPPPAAVKVGSRTTSPAEKADTRDSESANAFPPCVEYGVWTNAPFGPPDALVLKLEKLDTIESRSIKQRGVMSFHTFGCSGDAKDHLNGLQVAKAITAQISDPHSEGGSPYAVPASFLLHLGSPVYADEDPSAPQKNTAQLYDSEFYAQYTMYPRKILAIPGNMDSHLSEEERYSPIFHFLQNFCDSSVELSADNRTDKRQTITEPYLYWLFDTPLAYIVCLYTNDINGGQLDDPMGTATPQYDWLVKTLKAIKDIDDEKVVFLAIHDPPYSGQENFVERGDPNLGPTPRRAGATLRTIAEILQQAFHDSGKYPDIVLSSNAHLYQRIRYSNAQGPDVTYLIAGSGGRGPLEEISRTCTGSTAPRRDVPFDVVLPHGFVMPEGDSAKVVAYNDNDFGFVRLTVDLEHHAVIGEFFAVSREQNGHVPRATVTDTFTLDLNDHTIH